MYAMLVTLALVPGAEIKDKWQVLYSGHAAVGTSVIKDKAAWEKEWTLLHRKVKQRPAVPDVDFEQYMVVGYHWGNKPTGGYSVDLTRVRQSRLGTMVTVQKIKPKPDSTVTASETSPACFIVVPKIEGKVVFIPKLR